MRTSGIIICLLLGSLRTFGCNSCACAGNTGTFGFGPQFDQSLLSVRYESRNLVTTHPVNLMQPELDNHSSERIRRINLFGQYVYNNRLIAAVNVPYLNNTQVSDMESYNMQVSGLGDLSIYGGWSQPLYNDSARMRSLRLRAIAGVKLPTSRDRGPIYGEGLVAPVMQRGTGSTDLNLILSMALRMQNWYASGQYAFWENGINTQGYRYGRTHLCLLEISRNFTAGSTNIQPLITSRLINTTANQWENEDVDYTGGYVFDAAAGLRIARTRWMAEASCFIPLVQNQAGSQIMNERILQISLTHVFKK